MNKYDPLGLHSDTYNEWWLKARQKGWKLPVNTAFPDHSWLAYWISMDKYERGELEGRPVVPHRSA